MIDDNAESIGVGPGTDMSIAELRRKLTKWERSRKIPSQEWGKVSQRDKRRKRRKRKRNAK